MKNPALGSLLDKLGCWDLEKAFLISQIFSKGLERFMSLLVMLICLIEVKLSSVVGDLDDFTQDFSCYFMETWSSMWIIFATEIPQL